MDIGYRVRYRYEYQVRYEYEYQVRYEYEYVVKIKYSYNLVYNTFHQREEGKKS